MKRLLTAFAVAGIAFTLEAAPRVDLIAPRAGAILEGGHETVIEWSAASLPDHAEEWEAFLSFDGGKYYAVRITPHLDAGTRQFRWRVPNVAASSARILIRVGDEKDERVVEFPQTFRIVPGTDSLDPNVSTTEASGESALPASPPVIEWTSGDRRGAGLLTHRHRDHSALDHEYLLPDEDGLLAAFASSHVSLRPDGQASTVNKRITPAGRRLSVLRELRPLLLLATRLNI